MPDEATETEKELMKGNRHRLFGISKRQGDAATTGHLFWIVVVVGLLAVGIFAIVAVKLKLFHG